MTSALLVISVIDERTFEIPLPLNIFILILGFLATAVDYRNWLSHIIGLFCVSLVLYLIYVISDGRAIGGGDIKLMAAAGLLLGWKLIILAFFTGCILGSVFHLLRMKLSKAEHMLAMGPYLSAGIFICALWGNKMIEWYLSLVGLA
jgi:leader peptidase (prepilin peptidase)/N-methyltransferase